MPRAHPIRVGCECFLPRRDCPCRSSSVDLRAGEQHSSAYRAINPRRVVPTLVLHEGTAIGEVPAIWRYFEETNPEPPMLGANPRDKALVTM
jgi:glutathione S-transferase